MQNLTRTKTSSLNIKVKLYIILDSSKPPRDAGRNVTDDSGSGAKNDKNMERNMVHETKNEPDHMNKKKDDLSDFERKTSAPKNQK